MQKKDRLLPPYLDRPSLDSIEERELDLLLLYELHSCPAFRQRLISQFTQAAEISFVGCWRSVCDLGGETDILLLCDLQQHGRTAFMIEHKIDAAFQNNQARRYRERGAAGRADEAWDSFFTCLCAPGLFLAPLRETDEWDVYLAFEEINTWLSTLPQQDARSGFFSAALKHATEKYQRGGFVPDVRATAFWRAYRDYCAADFPDLRIRGLSDLQSRNEPWPGFVMPSSAVGAHIEHKPSKGHVDLTLDREHADSVRMCLRGEIPDSFEVVKVGKSAALRIAVKPLRHLESFDEQRPAVRDALEAVRLLLGEWHRLRALLDR